MVERQAAVRASAVDAAPAVTREERAARDLALHEPRDAHVVDESDDVWPLERRSGRAKRSVQLFDHLGLALVDEDVRTPYRADVQWLETRVQDENLLHPPENYPKAGWPENLRHTARAGAQPGSCPGEAQATGEATRQERGRGGKPGGCGESAIDEIRALIGAVAAHRPNPHALASWLDGVSAA